MAGWSDLEGYHLMAIFRYPSAHIGQIYIRRGSRWALWQLISLSEDGTEFVVSCGAARSYSDALQSLNSVAAMWVASGTNFIEERTENKNIAAADVSQVHRHLGLVQDRD